MKRTYLSLTIAVAISLAGCNQDTQATTQQPSQKTEVVTEKAKVGYKGTVYSPYVAQDFPTQVFFGDTHLHTSVSLDAFGDGNTTIGPDEAYRWAKGEVVAADDGMPTRISKPLDFLVVADHAEYLGLVPGLAKKDPLLMKNKEGARWAKMIEEGKMASHVFSEFIYDVTGNKPRMVNEEFSQSVWDNIIDSAEEHNQPGKFTAFIGFEFSAFPNGNNLHRVVVFKDDKALTEQVLPFSAFDSNDPAKLWDYLEGYETKTGGNVLAIPHNGNISGGRMFALQDFNDNALTREYAEKRMKWEPIYEVTQYKGDGETHPYLSPDDQFADFETWDKANLAMLEPHKDEYYKYEYARSALQVGLQQEDSLGVNPFKFGMIGSTDSHTGLAQTSEDNFHGKYGVASPNAENKDRWKKEWPPVEGTVAKMFGWESSSAGYAAVWAQENTRASIFEAMERKEVYATTGPRMVVRTFGGFEFKKEDAFRPNFAATGYAKGVPMGGDLTDAPQDAAFSMLVSANKDPDGANLDRVQVIKGWMDSSGKLLEKVYDVAVSDGRDIAKGKVSKPVGSTVDLKTATYTNEIGAANLAVTWVDPDFDASQRAFYYVRVLEIPTPRWTAYDVVRLGSEMPEEVPMVLQERAYTSPIWYTPK